jgi:hypothetical protein
MVVRTRGPEPPFVLPANPSRRTEGLEQAAFAQDILECKGTIFMLAFYRANQDFPRHGSNQWQAPLLMHFFLFLDFLQGHTKALPFCVYIG